MSMLEELIARARAAVPELRAARDECDLELRALRDKLDAGDTTVTAERILAARARKSAANDLLDEQRSLVESYEQELRDEQSAKALAARVAPGHVAPSSLNGSVYQPRARVGSEPSTYAGRRQDTEPSFLQDLYQHQVHHDPIAGERIARHAREIEQTRPDLAERVVGSGGVSGFVPPQYLQELYAEYSRAGRPVADLCRFLPLPEVGMTFQIPRITTATSTAIQTAENATISETDIDDTLLSVPVGTIAGQQNLSRQSIERGILVEDVVFSDLAADYNAKLDVQVVNGSGSSGQHLGILGVSGINAIIYTDGTPTLAELWPKLADAIGQVQSTRYTGPTAWVMHPRRWAWMLAALDSTSRPFVTTNAQGPNNALATSTEVGYGVPVGSLMGLPVVTSGAVPTNLGGGTNEDRIIVAAWDDIILGEDAGRAPVQLRFDDVGSATLTVRLVAYGYTALAAGRQPKSISVVSGTGLVAPTL